MTDFKTGALNRSATHPYQEYQLVKLFLQENKREHWRPIGTQDVSRLSETCQRRIDGLGRFVIALSKQVSIDL